MRKMVEGFVHRPGLHCVLSSLRDIFEFHCHRFTEDVVFGLDCGLGFVYRPLKGSVLPIDRGDHTMSVPYLLIPSDEYDRLPADTTFGVTITERPGIP